MTNLTFVYRSGDDPAKRRLFADSRIGFLSQGQITVLDGTTTDETGHTTSYAIVRAFAFFDPDVPKVTGQVNPGELGLVPFQFLSGQLRIVRPETKNLLFGSSGPQHQFLDGSIRVLSQSAAVGSLTNFAIWSSAQAGDPYDGFIETATNATSGGVTEGYTRNSAIFTPNRRTRYLGVGTRVISVPNNGTWRTQYMKKWMLEKRPVGVTTPSAKYGKAREVIVKVKPDRLNYATNPGFEVGTNNWFALHTGSNESSNVRSKYNTRSMLVTNPSVASIVGASSPTSVVLPAGDWTLSLWVWSPIDLLGVLHVETEGPDPATSRQSTTPVPAGTWTQLVLQWSMERVSEYTTVTVWGMRNDGVPLSAGSTLNVDGVLMENTHVLREYFDGSTSADTRWELGGVTGASRSYLYKNYAERYAAIKRVLEDNVPLGIGIAEPVFGVLPD